MDFLAVCNGAGLAARAGVLDGHKATTNKQMWKAITPLGPKTHWVAHARYGHIPFCPAISSRIIPSADAIQMGSRRREQTVDKLWCVIRNRRYVGAGRPHLWQKQPRYPVRRCYQRRHGMEPRVRQCRRPFCYQQQCGRRGATAVEGSNISMTSSVSLVTVLSLELEFFLRP
jgi:hypothetical protein